ncbi:MULTISPECIES: excisionase family protein [Yersinia]|uniref:excisionase family protein n=1 Tax=Yersinia TaxID=629 RepID=UPI000EB5D2C4|nr:excisionase family protein [Yersinia sp. IP36721]
MDNVIQMNPSKWVSEDLLMSLTGMTKHMIQHARRKSWMEGREYRHVAPDLNPKENSPIMYNRQEIDNWVERQRPAIRRRIGERISA